MWIRYNNNPTGRSVGDCAVRAISKALNISWEQAFDLLAENAYQMGDMPSSNSVIGATLRMEGFKRTQVPNSCPDCFTVKEFCRINPKGRFVVGANSHVVAVVNGDYYDAWDSGNEVILYVWFYPIAPVFYT